MSDRSVTISLPHNWRPRGYQEPFWKAMESGCIHAVCLWHRRAGKDHAGFNWETTASQERKGLYWHMLPTYEQARKVIWDGKTNGGMPFISHIPSELIQRVRDDQMKIWLRNGSLIQLVGADEPDRLVGANPCGINFSEYSVSPKYETCYRLLAPILAANGGWAVFQYTARGRNHGYRLYNATKELARRDPQRYFCQLLTVDDTFDEHGRPVVSQAEIQSQRDLGMSEEMIRQEYYCDFNIALVGSYYGRYLAEARAEGRIGKVPWVPDIPVDTGWDLGSANATCIWFKQQVGAEKRIIDFHMGSGADLAHYVKVLKEKPYVYGKHYLPHDVEVTEMNARQSRKEILRSLGVKATVVPRIQKVDDGIEIVRNYLRSCWFDEANCDREKTETSSAMPGIQGLLEYVRKETGERGPTGDPFYSDEPLKNWTTDVADAFRTLACGDKGRGSYGLDQKPGKGRGPSPFAGRVAIV